MTLKRKGWKKYAKMAMGGNLGILIAGMFMTIMANIAANSLTNYFFSGSGLFTFILAELFSFIVSLVLNILIAGYAYMNLKVARYEKALVSDVFYFFRNGSDRVIIAGFVMALLQFIASIPLLIFNYTSVIGETREALLDWEIRFLGLMLLTLVLQMLFSIPFSMTYYLLADDPELSGMDAIRGSLSMMKHHMGSYLIMKISFLPWLIGSVFTFYIGLIWVIPYMNMVEAEFYRDLHGEFIVQSAYTEQNESMQ